MNDLRSTFAVNGHPLHPLLVPIPIGLFVSTLVSDAVFVGGGTAGWAEASRWLLGGGLAGALLAALAGFTDFAANPRIREFRAAWRHLFANLTLVLVEGINLILRLPDAGVAGSFGIVLSAVAVLVLLFSGWQGGELVFRHGVGQIERR